MKPGVILSMEQALSMTSATLRFVQLGWRVIKLEATPHSPGALPGVPTATRLAGRRTRGAELFHRAERRKESIRST